MILWLKNKIFLFKIALLDADKLRWAVKMKEKELDQKQELINELLARLKPDPEYKGYDTSIEDGYVINPIWQVKVSYFGQKVTAMPFLYYIHSHLKTYGFDPDNKMRDKGLEVSIAMRQNEEGIILPFYIKGSTLPSGERLENLDPNVGEIKNPKTGVSVKQKDLLK